MTLYTDSLKSKESKSESHSVMSGLFVTRWTNTVHGILQAKILEWEAFPFFRWSSQPRDQTQISHVVGRFLTSRAAREAQEDWSE